MDVQDIINDLTSRKAKLEQCGGEVEVKQLHGQGKLTARERVENLLDTDSFVEVGGFIKHRSTDFNLSVKETPADGVITGYGTIDGRLVYVYSQDSTVLGGALGEMHAKKICKIYDMAIKMGAPIIALVDSAGLRLQESLDALDGFGAIFYKQTLASGVVPQITAILGDCGGGATLIPSLSDFAFMTKNDSSLFVNSPNALDDKTASMETVASADFHGSETGIVDFICDDERSCLEEIRSLINMLPSNNVEDAPVDENDDDLNRIVSELNTIIPNDEKAGFDVKGIIQAIADNNLFLETKANYSTTMVTGLITLDGLTVGVIANQSLNNESYMTSKGCEKATKFVNFCDSFNIPVVTFTDVTGFMATIAEEKAGISNKVSKLLYAFANATIPKINVVVRKAYGSAYLAMNSKHIGADLVYAWPTAKISLMNADSAVKIMYSDEIKQANSQDIVNEKVTEYEEIQSSPYVAAGRGYIDDIIEPSATRKRVIAALEMLYTKREVKPTKKHSSI